MDPDTQQLETALDAWRQRAATFRWEIPERFNFGIDVVDALPPGNPALWWRDEAGRERRLDFGAVQCGSNRVAHLLRSLGLGPGDPLIVALPRIPEWHLVLVGALKAGLLVIPSSTLLRPKDLVYRARHSGARALVAAGEAVTAAESVRKELPGLESLVAWSPERPPPPGWIDLGRALEAQPSDPGAVASTRAVDPALVYYTSGTTGPPKAVLHAHAYTFSQRLTATLWHGLREGDRIWTTSDTGWAKAAYGVLFGPWSVGAEVFLFDGRFEPRRELRLLAEVRPDVFCAPPTEYRLLVKEDLSGVRGAGLRECVSAGEPLNPEVMRTWRDATGHTIRDGYGQTETILLVGNFPGMPVRPGSMGLPMPGHDVAVVDEAGRVLPPNEIGDVALRGDPPSLFREYWKDSAATAACHRGEWYVTGDRAFCDRDGFYWFVGRADDVIISAGYRIGPFEVESALLEHADVVEAAVVGAPDPDRGQIVAAYVVLRPGVRGDEALARSLQEHVKRVTAPYKYPRRVAFVATLPKTVSGKIRRVELRAAAARTSP